MQHKSSWCSNCRLKVPGSQMSQEDALLAKSGLTKAVRPVVAMLAASLALAWGGGWSSSLHQVMLQQRRPQQLCMRAAQVLLSCAGMQHIRILTGMLCTYSSVTHA